MKKAQSVSKFELNNTGEQQPDSLGPLFVIPTEMALARLNHHFQQSHLYFFPLSGPIWKRHSYFIIQLPTIVYHPYYE
jgi:hypothetical protein